MQDPVRPVRADFGFWSTLAVRWADMDAMGHVNNVVYFRYLESARVAYFETRGWNSAGRPQQGPVMVAQSFNYRRQLHYPAEIEVGVACTEVRRRSLVLSYGIFRKDSDEIIGDGTSTLAWLDYALGRAVEIPPNVRTLLTSRP